MTSIFDPFLVLKKIINIIINNIASISNYFTNCDSEDIIMNRNPSQTSIIPNTSDSLETISKCRFKLMILKCKFAIRIIESQYKTKYEI